MEVHFCNSGQISIDCLVKQIPQFSGFKNYSRWIAEQPCVGQHLLDQMPNGIFHDKEAITSLPQKKLPFHSISKARMTWHSYDVLIMHAIPNSHWLMVMSLVIQCTVHGFLSIQMFQFSIRTIFLKLFGIITLIVNPNMIKHCVILILHVWPLNI